MTKGPKRRSQGFQLFFERINWRLTFVDGVVVSVLLWCGVYLAIVSLWMLWA
jgi:hypothetical protein